MAERNNRDPTYDLARHIVTGERGPLSGEGISRDMDRDLDRNDPMDPFTANRGDNFIVPQSAEAVQQANLTQAMGLSPQSEADGNFMEPVDMAAANDCLDEPSKGGLAYGPRNTGGY